MFDTPDVTPLIWLVIIVGIPLAAWFYFPYHERKKERNRIIQAEANRLQRVDDIRHKVNPNDYKALKERRVVIGWDMEFTRLSWGQPTKVDQREVTAKGLTKERWVYGTPRRGKPAQYVYFKNGKVDKLKG